MATLLDKALELPPGKHDPTKYNTEEITELALAFCERRVTSKQVAQALKINQSNVSALIGLALIRGIHLGVLTITKAEGKP